MKAYAIIVTLLLLLSLFLHYDREVERGITVKDLELQVVNHKSISDSVSNYYEKLIKEKDSTFYYNFKDAEERALRYEASARQAQIELKNERNFNRRFSDSQTDSLLSRVGLN